MTEGREEEEEKEEKEEEQIGACTVYAISRLCKFRVCMEPIYSVHARKHQVSRPPVVLLQHPAQCACVQAGHALAPQQVNAEAPPLLPPTHKPMGEMSWNDYYNHYFWFQQLQPAGITFLQFNYATYSSKKCLALQGSCRETQSVTTNIITTVQHCWSAQA